MCRSLEELAVLRHTAVALRDVPGCQTPVPALVGRGGVRVGLAWPAAADEVRAAGYTHGDHVQGPLCLPGVGARPRDSVPGTLGRAQRRRHDVHATRARGCHRRCSLRRTVVWSSRARASRTAGDSWAGGSSRGLGQCGVGGGREGHTCRARDHQFRRASPRCATEEKGLQPVKYCLPPYHGTQCPL